MVAALYSATACGGGGGGGGAFVVVSCDVAVADVVMALLWVAGVDTCVVPCAAAAAAAAATGSAPVAAPLGAGGMSLAAAAPWCATPEVSLDDARAPLPPAMTRGEARGGPSPMVLLGAPPL